MRYTTWLLVACTAVLWATGCGWTPQTPPPEPQVEIIGAQPSELTPQPPSPDNPNAGMGQVVKGSRGVDRSVWPQQRIEVGRPVIPQRRVLFQSPAEFAVGTEPEEYWTWRDFWETVRAQAHFLRDVALLPVEPWRKEEVSAVPQAPDE